MSVTVPMGTAPRRAQGVSLRHHRATDSEMKLHVICNKGVDGELGWINGQFTISSLAHASNIGLLNR